MSEFIKVDFTYAKPKFQYFKDDNLVKTWNTKKAYAQAMICDIIDGQGLGNFEANRLKAKVIEVADIFDPNTIKIIRKEKSKDECNA